MIMVLYFVGREDRVVNKGIGGIDFIGGIKSINEELKVGFLLFGE